MYSTGKKILPALAFGVLLLGCIWYFLHGEEGREIRTVREQAPAASIAPNPGSVPVRGEMTPGRAEEAGTESVAAEYPKDIEEIKKQVYDLNIEYVEDLPKLDKVVQTGDAPTKDFWQGNWASVDDNKADINGFFLRPQEDGTFVYFPDENSARTYTFFETPQTYTYDPVHKEFSWDIDYYGKTISHRVRFINDNVMATMLISGRKVVLDLYQKQKDPE
jgi:hypothetical protein